MIAIQNISKKYSKTDWQYYQISINSQLICRFKHKASDGLAECLKKASIAVEKNEDNKVGKWAITMVMPPYPTGVGEIVNNYQDCWKIKMPYGTELWLKNNCEVFNTQKQAQEAYDKFTRNKNNYACEG